MTFRGERRVRAALAICGAAAAMTAGVAEAAPVVIFDTTVGGNEMTDVINGNDGIGAQIVVGNQDATLNYISIRADLSGAGKIKFLVFRHSDHALVYVSPAKNFADNGLMWKMSDQFTYVLKAGTTYDIGAVIDVNTTWAFDQVPAMMGNFKSISMNGYFSSFANPVFQYHALADPAIRLHSEIVDCGDGIVEAGEQCDDADQDDGDACPTNCQNAKCGDGFVRSGVEDCDDGNAANTDACLTTCELASCGDGYVHAGVEECDDGNGNYTDACLPTCKAASCGDGHVGPGESCDDGNSNNDDACTNACVQASCGDGEVEGSEECDDGNAIEDDACTNACTLPVCGDGIVQAGEQCDDGNAIEDDECTGACAVPGPQTTAPDETTGGDATTGEPGLTDTGSEADVSTGGGPQTDTGAPPTTSSGDEPDPPDSGNGVPITTAALTLGPEPDDGCACAAHSRTGAPLWLLGLGLGLVHRRRRRAV